MQHFQKYLFTFHNEILFDLILQMLISLLFLYLSQLASNIVLDLEKETSIILLTLLNSSVE